MSQAFGATRYASPSGSGSACTQASPCGLKTAVEVIATNGDEVVMAAGDYGLGFSGLTVDDAINLHGAAGQPRPRITSGFNDAVTVDNPGARIADVEIAHGGTSDGLFLYQGTAERLVVHTTSTADDACGPYNAAVLRDSVCWTDEPFAAAVATSSGGFVHTPRLRNVTAIATGTDSIGILVDTASGAQVSLRGKNVITRGVADDLSAMTDSGASTGALIALDHSNYVDVSATGTDAAVTGSSTNQTAAPLFANAAAGNFHQLAGSPTINAGTVDPLLGALDIDRQARNQGAAPDIGADEFPTTGGGGGGGGGSPPPGSGTPPPGGGTPSNEFSFGKVKKNKRKGTAKLTVKVPGPGELDLAKTKKLKADEDLAEAEGKEKLAIKPKGKAQKKLNERGKAKVKANVTFTPDGGGAKTESKKIKLVKR